MSSQPSQSEGSNEPQEKPFLENSGYADEQPGAREYDGTQPNTPGQTFDLQTNRKNGSYYNLQKMNAMHHEIVRRIVVGQKDHEIAKALGITKATVKYTRESPVVQEKLNTLMGQRDASATEMHKRLKSIAPLALHRMEEIMEDDSESGATRAKVAMDILDRAGYKPVNKTANVTKMGPDRISEIKERAKNLDEVEIIQEAEVIEEESAEGTKDGQAD